MHFRRFIYDNGGFISDNDTEGVIICGNIEFHFKLKNGKINLSSSVYFYIDNVGKNIVMA